MAGTVSRGEVWMYEFSRPDKERPVLVLTRDDAIPFLRTVMVAPIRSAIRGLPSEVVVGVVDGLKKDSAITLDHVQTVERSLLRRYVTTLKADRMRAVCRALAVAAGCDS